MNGSASRPKLGDEEWDALRHQARNEVDVARESVELGDHDRRSLATPFGLGERRLELRAAFERVRSLASLDLDVLGNDFEPLGLGEAGDRGALRIEAQAAPALLGRADAIVPNHRWHAAIAP